VHINSSTTQHGNYPCTRQPTLAMNRRADRGDRFALPVAVVIIALFVSVVVLATEEPGQGPWAGPPGESRRDLPSGWDTAVLQDYEFTEGKIAAVFQRFARLLEQAHQLPLELLGLATDPPPAGGPLAPPPPEEEERPGGRRRSLLQEEPSRALLAAAGGAGAAAAGPQQAAEVGELWSIEDDDGDDGDGLAVHENEEGPAGAGADDDDQAGTIAATPAGGGGSPRQQDAAAGDTRAPGVVRRTLSVDLPDLSLSAGDLQKLAAAAGLDLADLTFPAAAAAATAAAAPEPGGGARPAAGAPALDATDDGGDEEDSAAAGHILHRLLAGLDQPGGGVEGRRVGGYTAAGLQRPSRARGGGVAGEGAAEGAAAAAAGLGDQQGRGAAHHEPLRWLQQLERLAAAAANASSGVGRIRHLGSVVGSAGSTGTGDGEPAARRRLQQALAASASGGNNGLFASSFKLIFGNALDFFIGGRFPATILGDLRNTIANYNWIRDLADFLDAPFENFANANFLPLPQDNDEVRWLAGWLAACLPASLPALSAPPHPPPGPAAALLCWVCPGLGRH
jgi:hypothetical protein